MAASLCGKWKQVSSENFAALLDCLGVPDERKGVFMSNKACMEIGNEGDTWTFKLTVMGKTREDRFKLGEETDGVSIVDSTPLKYTVTRDGQALVEVSRGKDRESKTRRYVEGGQLVSEFSVGAVTGVLKFDKAE